MSRYTVGRLRELWQVGAKVLQEAQYHTTTATTVLPYSSVAFSDHNP
jgi:hypothetical protein